MGDPIKLTGHAGTIYAYLRDHGPNYGNELSRKLGIGTGRCSVTLNQLQDRGLLVSEIVPDVSSTGAPRRYFAVANQDADVIAEAATGPSPKAAKNLANGRRVTLKGVSEHYAADEIEELVRAVAEIVGGGMLRDSLSERQIELAEDAYRRLIAKFDNGSDGPDVDGREDDQSFYAALRDHAHDYGVQVTWTAVYKQFRSGKLAMREKKLLAFLGTVLSWHRAYDPLSGPDAGWSIVTASTGDLANGELFSIDDGFTWHACQRQWLQVVSCYHGGGRDKDARLYRVYAGPDGECLVVRRT